jgi:hypothetical protein
MSFNSEIIAYSEEYEKDNGFYIAVKNLNNKEVSRKELSVWGFKKSLSVCLLIRTSKPNYGNLEMPESPEMYKVDITYSVNPTAKSLYLKQETQQSDSNDSVVTKIFLKDVNSGSCQSLPVPSQLYKDEFPITITKSKGQLISISDSVKLLKSGLCLGVFNDDLTRKFLF